MNRQFTEISLARPQRQKLAASRRTSQLSHHAQITDAAFADLDATTLRLDKPLPVESRPLKVQPDHDLLHQLAGQLKSLDQQRERLTRLLNELQTPPTAAV